MQGGSDALIQVILKEDIFPVIQPGDMDAVTAVYQEFFGVADALAVTGREEVFLAANEGVGTVGECLAAATERLITIGVVPGKASSSKQSWQEIC
ncbi:hypothetical protein Ct61P_15481 [Colletotrichum tofieldiae]|nr:hypothetical protein Ct61P_15481 [Colletotrichum tofieldiae]